MDEDIIKSFGVVDFIVLGAVLLLTISIGIYYAITDRESKNMETYNFGERKMSPIPVGLSITATYISAFTFVAFPAEVYLFGTIMFWFSFACIFPTFFTYMYYIPLMHRLQISSIYEYFELRFHRRLRKLGSFLECFTLTFGMAMMIYIPGLALSAVTPLGLTTTIVITSAICIFYTALGGMKAVVWADTLQTFIMLAGALSVLIKTTLEVGGFEKAWIALEKGDRLNFLNFDPNPTIRNTFWTIICGTAIAWSTPNQAIMQRYLSCVSLSESRKAALVAVVPNIIFIALGITNGALMFAYFQDCDPLSLREVEKADQLMPYLVVNIFHDLPGMAGLFVAAAFSGTLSTVSSGINALAALIMHDFVSLRKPNLSEAAKVTISKIVVITFGTVVTCFSIAVQYINGTITQIGYTVVGTIIGGVSGVFALGIFCPWANSKGALTGQICGTVFTAWLGVCGFLYGRPFSSQALPLSTEGCLGNDMKNITEEPEATSTIIRKINFTTTIASGSNDLSTTLYAVSYLYFAAIGLLITVTVGTLISFLTGANKPSEANPDLFLPLVSNPILPEKVQHFFRLGVPELDKKIKKQSLSQERTLVYNETKKLSSDDDDDEITETDI